MKTSKQDKRGVPTPGHPEHYCTYVKIVG